MFDLIFEFIKNWIFKTTILEESTVNNACTLITVIILSLIIVLFIRLVMWAFYVVYKPFKGGKR